MEKLVTTLGVSIGLLNPEHEGRLLLRRRAEAGSIIPGQSFLGNWELPVGGVMEPEVTRYDHLMLEAIRALEKETGIELVVSADQILHMYTALFKGSQGYDLAGVMPVVYALEPTMGEFCWVSPEELDQLARDFVSATDAKSQGLNEAHGIVSGWGKRMHWMGLCALTHSPNREFVLQAENTIRQIQESW